MNIFSDPRRALPKVTAAMFGLLLGLALLVPPAPAQQLAVARGEAVKLDYPALARGVSMHESYNRALYLYIRSNPTAFDDPQFYVNFLIYLMNQSEGFNCQKAFSSEFERREFFTNAFSIKDQLRQIVGAARVPERFDVSFIVSTGAYDFATATLPYSNTRAVSGRSLMSNRISDDNRVRNCAQQILQGTSVSSEAFVWDFQVVDENLQRFNTSFPFGSSIQLSDTDAQVLFNQFGRTLYAIVGYSFQAANNGQRIIQVIPTDGQLFGLSSNSVVRVQTYTHPRLSQPNYLDITSPLTLGAENMGSKFQLKFQQNGFRAVGAGTRQDRGTGLTSGAVAKVSGSAAVGGSSFVMRLETPGIFDRNGAFTGATGGATYLTLFGQVDFEGITVERAPVSGQMEALILRPGAAQLEDGPKTRFTGYFSAATEEAAPEPEAEAQPASKLDTSPVIDESAEATPPAESAAPATPSGD